MPVDARIPLSDTHAWNPMDAITMQQLAMQMKTQQMNYNEQLRQQQVRGSVMDLYRNQENVDPATGMLTPVALNKISSIDPHTGMEMRGQQLTAVAKQTTIDKNKAQTRASDLEAQGRQIDAVHDSAINIRNFYQGQRNKGIPEKQAIENTQSMYTDEVARLKKSGHFTEDVIDRMPAAFDPAVIEKAITGTETYRSRKEMETPFVKELEAAGYVRGTPQWQMAMDARIKKETTLPASANVAPLAGDDLKSAGGSAATGMPLTQVVPGYGNAAVTQRQKVRNEAIRQIQEETGASAIDAGKEFARRQIDFVAGKRSVSQLNTMLGATKQAVAQLDFNIDETVKLLKKMPSSDLSPVINAIIRGEEKWTGDPKYSSLFFYMNASAMESARILQGGQASVAQLHAGAAEEARKWANVNMTPKSFIDGVGPSMKQEGHFRIKTFVDAIDSQRNAGDAKKPDAEKTPPPAKNAKGWALHKDAKGNMAYVSPDGKEFEEAH